MQAAGRLAAAWRLERQAQTQRHASWHVLVARQFCALAPAARSRDADVVVVGGGHAGACFAHPSP